MKKIISLVLTAMLTLSLAACGTKNDSKGDQPAAPELCIRDSNNQKHKSHV